MITVFFYKKKQQPPSLTTNHIPKGPMSVCSARGITFFSTQSLKLARLNSIVSIYEMEVNENLSYEVKDWE